MDYTSPNKNMKTGDYAQTFEGGVGGYPKFRMKAADYNNSPMDKNFGINGNKPEMAIKTKAPLESSPAKGFFGDMMEKIKGRLQANQSGAIASSNQSNSFAGGELESGEEAMPVNQGRGVMPEANKVPMHGMESHEGGKRKGGFMGKARGIIGGGAQAGGAQDRGALGSLFSDIRLKEKIEKTGVSPSGIPIYEFNYIGGANRYSGAMAQDLLAINSDAVSLDESGYYKVNYNNIDVSMYQIN